MKKSLILLSAGLLATQLSFAYQVEVAATANNSSSTLKPDNQTNDTDTDIALYGISATYFFKDVSVNDAPLAKAAFLSKASNIGIVYATGSLEIKSGTTKIDADADAGGLNGRAVINERFIIAADFQKAEVDVDDSDVNGENKTAAIGFGAYITDNIAVIGSLTKGEATTKSATNTLTTDSQGVNAAVEAFLPLSDGRGLSFDGGLSLATTNNKNGNTEADGVNINIDFSASYYFTHQLGLTAYVGISSEVMDDESIANNNNKDFITSSSSTIGFSAEYFINENFAVFGEIEASNTETEADNSQSTTSDSEETGTSLAVGIKGRF